MAAISVSKQKIARKKITAIWFQTSLPPNKGIMGSPMIGVTRTSWMRIARHWKDTNKAKRRSVAPTKNILLQGRRLPWERDSSAVALDRVNLPPSSFSLTQTPQDASVSPSFSRAWIQHSVESIKIHSLSKLHLHHTSFNSRNVNFVFLVSSYLNHGVFFPVDTALKPNGAVW